MDMETSTLAAAYELSGGQIENVARKHYQCGAARRAGEPSAVVACRMRCWETEQ